MSRIFSSVDQLIGKTPILELTQIEKSEELRARLLAKLEFFNPTGSVKDRAADAMIREAEKSGKLTPGSVIIEPTSGNMGISLAAAAAARGYRAIIVMPESMSPERRQLIRAYGAELVLTEAAGGMSGAISRAEMLAETIPGSFLPRQFSNPVNSAAHMASTGPEIWEDTDGRIDILVAGVGSGGTITGTGAYLKHRNPNIRIVAAEPFSSPVLSGGVPASHAIQGIGAGFIPDVLDTGIYDEIIPVKDEDAFDTARKLGRSVGILVGISSGAAVRAAIELAKRVENRKKIIVSVLPDSGERYLSTPLFAD